VRRSAGRAAACAAPIARDGALPRGLTDRLQRVAANARRRPGFFPSGALLITRRWSPITAFLVCFCAAAVTHAAGSGLPPAVPPPQPIVLPSPAVRTLPNGLEVVVLERNGLPIVTFDLAIKSGSEADPPKLPGTAEFVASMLDEGTTKRTAQQIAAALDGAGGSLDTGAEWDDSYATITILSNHVRLAFDLLSDIAIRPAFDPAEVERIRTQTVSALDVLRQDPEYLADTLVDEVAFQGTPYSHPANGVIGSIRDISKETLREFHARYYQPSNALLVIVGDISASTAFALAKKYFGGWQNGQPIPPIKSLSAPSSLSPRVVAIDDPNAVQTVIRIADRAIDRTSVDYPALMIANQVLGGPAENLLFSALRTRRGLVYGASSDLDCYRLAGIWEEKTATQTPDTLKAVQLVLDQMRKLRGHAFGSWELHNAQNYLVGHMALDFESSQDIADRLIELLVYGLPLDEWNTFPQKIDHLQVNGVRAAIRTYLDPDDAVIVLVGNLAGFRRQLKKFGPVQMVNLSRLDLSSGSLEVQAATAAAR
jgi:zinc protease